MEAAVVPSLANSYPGWRRQEGAATTLSQTCHKVGVRKEYPPPTPLGQMGSSCGGCALFCSTRKGLLGSSERALPSSAPSRCLRVSVSLAVLCLQVRGFGGDEGTPGLHSAAGSPSLLCAPIPSSPAGG